MATNRPPLAREIPVHIQCADGGWAQAPYYVHDGQVVTPRYLAADERDKLLEVSAAKRQRWVREHPDGAPESTGHLRTA
mgnify:CR=1 FL=1